MQGLSEVGTNVEGSSNLFQSIEDKGTLGIKVSSPTHLSTEVGSRLVRRFSRKNLDADDQNVDQNVEQNGDKIKKERKKSVWFKDDPVYSDASSDEARFTFRTFPPEKQGFKAGDSSNGNVNQILNPDEHVNESRQHDEPSLETTVQNMTDKKDEIKNVESDESDECITFNINRSDDPPAVVTPIANGETNETFNSEKHFPLSTFQLEDSGDKNPVAILEDLELNKNEESLQVATDQTPLEEENFVLSTNSGNDLKSLTSTDNNTLGIATVLQLDSTTTKDSQELEFFPPKFKDDSPKFKSEEEEAVSFQKQENESGLSDSNEIEKEEAKSRENQFETNFLPEENVFSFPENSTEPIIKEEATEVPSLKEIHLETNDTYDPIIQVDINLDSITQLEAIPTTLALVENNLQDFEKETSNDSEEKDEKLSPINFNEDTDAKQVDSKVNEESFNDSIEDAENANQERSDHYYETNPNVNPEGPKTSEKLSTDENFKLSDITFQSVQEILKDLKSSQSSDSSEEDSVENSTTQFPISETRKKGEKTSKRVSFDENSFSNFVVVKSKEEDLREFKPNEDDLSSEVFTKWDPDKEDSCIKNDPFEGDNPFSDFKLRSSQPDDPWGNPSSDQPANPVSLDFDQDQFVPHFEAPIEAVTFSAKPFERYFEHSDILASYRNCEHHLHYNFY